MSERVVLDGQSLSPSVLYSIGQRRDVSVAVAESAWAKVGTGRAVVDEVIAQSRVVYGINTGFGMFSKVVISDTDLEALQLNLIRSHCVGVGDYLTLQQSRMMLALRINVLAKGHSGISVETLGQLIDALNGNCISCVPSQVSLSHSLTVSVRLIECREV